MNIIIIFINRIILMIIYVIFNFPWKNFHRTSIITCNKNILKTNDGIKINFIQYDDVKYSDLKLMNIIVRENLPALFYN